jgi:drug/metabolite transporter (DMT)-like permease
MLIALAVIWAFSYLFMQWGVDELPVMTVVFGRVAFAALLLVVLVYATGQRLPTSAKVWAGLAAMAILNNVIPFGMIIGAQGIGVDSGLVSILVGLTPVFSVVLAHYLTLEERMTPARIGGCLLGLVGLAVLVGPAALEGLGDQMTGQLMAVAAALSYALAAIVGRRMLAALPPMTAATGQLMCSSLLILPWVLAIDQPWTYSPSLTAWAGILGVAIPCTAFAYILYFAALRSAGATNLMLVTLMVPIGAVIVGAMFLNERVGWETIGGMALISLGLLLIDGRVFRLWKRAGATEPSGG